VGFFNSVTESHAVSPEANIPARLVPHSVVYAASALPMEFPKNFHGQSALKVRNDIHKLKKNLAALVPHTIHCCRT
jgi:hypothetical protein